MVVALCILLLLFQTHDVTGKMTGITLPLIHPESPQSLVSRSNQTHEQRIRLINQSHARVAGYFPTNTSSVAQSTSPYNVIPDLVRPQVGVQYPYYYMVKVGIGTFTARPPYPSFKSYYLYMDTGSDLTWIQCEGCRAPGGRCFNQKEPVYPNSLSGSYYPLPCKKHKLCAPNQCINASCSYNVRYLDNTSSSGILASENFVFNSTSGKMEVLKNLVYGCGVDNRKNYGNYSNQIAGIMGLGWGSYSILSQANSLTEGRFSLRGDGSGGCIIDSGTPFSRLTKPAYVELVKALKRYFWGQRNLKPYKGPKGLELCYERRKAEGFKNLPSMTFHLKNADLVVQPQALFLVMDKISSVKGEYICLAILSSDFISVIGSYQQTNQRLIYNTKQQQLLFSPENCSKDA
ncbi:UNVERIFIED_CONTAM: Aspartic proteinase Asp1 [Sesamum calycinum]|uniref:Aspartic proteinase Asp1 n=1 Tax=Sesamum calycinum TaxID=2727403 RepID=A0AAW2SB24_9LAMI